MSTHKCVRDKLLSIIDDIELISKELFEIVLTPKTQRQNMTLDNNQLADLLVAKDKELKNALVLASEQEEIQKKMNALKCEIDKQDEEMRQFQKHLKEAEHILSTAIYQAKQKLSMISRANSHPISSEELIKYAHKISAAHSVSAPYNWEQGDQRRPYPTDIEMRSGLLANFNDQNITSNLMQQQSQHQSGAYGAQQQMELTRPSSTASTSSGSSFAWQNDIKPNISALATFQPSHHGLDVKTNKENDDVEVMSTDSSSSSSSDSQ